VDPNIRKDPPSPFVVSLSFSSLSSAGGEREEVEGETASDLPRSGVLTMDFMKVFDQAVREIKREVNLKVLKVPEMEQKVLDATNNEPWGPHGSDLAEISQATKRSSECHMIMSVLWTRLADSAPNWRHVYKALSVIEYLVANGSERAVEDISEHSFQISSLSSFEYVEPSGKDVGINVRKKVETILALLNDKDKMQAVRNKAAANRDKYVGLSSTGMSYKSSSALYGSSSFEKNDTYGGLRGSKEDETFKDSYKDVDHYGDDHGKTQTSYSGVTNGTKSKKGTSHPDRVSKASVEHDTSKSSSSQINTSPDDFDDFDPRGSSKSESATANPKKVDLFGDALVGDLIDVETSVSGETATLNAGSADEVDLFAGATFVSAASHAATSTGHDVKGQFDLFAEQPSVPASSLSNVDLFATPNPGVSTGLKPPVPVSSSNNTFDPFAAVPLNISEESDLFGAFVSHTDSTSPEQTQNSGNDSLGNANITSISSKPGPKKETFQVKSGIWADSLSRGLIDLNLTAPKKVALSDVGVVGRLDVSDETRHPASVFPGRGLGAASGPSKPAYPYSTGASGSGSFSNW
ncbi:hypothetical protein Taro_016996, partial [Colocasia esculenta]|nr:hypothetical protein [Colocasia esculenta]